MERKEEYADGFRKGIPIGLGYLPVSFTFGVMAVAGGTVASVEQDDLMGTTVTIVHAGGLESIYANLAEAPAVEAGDEVAVGEVIGATGTTAAAESARAPHLHLEMWKEGESVDPLDYLPEQS